MNPVQWVNLGNEGVEMFKGFAYKGSSFLACLHYIYRSKSVTGEIAFVSLKC